MATPIDTTTTKQTDKIHRYYSTDGFYSMPIVHYIEFGKFLSIIAKIIVRLSMRV